LYAELQRRRPGEYIGDRGPGAWLRSHRIYPIVTSIDVEHTVLFVMPILYVLGVDFLLAGLVAAATFFSLQSARFYVSSLRAGRSLDQQQSSP
jgi:hypothetical protein